MLECKGLKHCTPDCLLLHIRWCFPEYIDGANISSTNPMYYGLLHHAKNKKWCRYELLQWRQHIFMIGNFSLSNHVVLKTQTFIFITKGLFKIVILLFPIIITPADLEWHWRYLCSPCSFMSQSFFIKLYKLLSCWKGNLERGMYHSEI